MPQDVLERLGINPSQMKKKGAKTFHRGKGCRRCNETGYYGRIAILEAMLITDPIRSMIMKKASSDEIKEYAIKEQGMLTLRDNAVDNCIIGITTLEEVLRATSED